MGEKERKSLGELECENSDVRWALFIGVIHEKTGPILIASSKGQSVICEESEKVQSDRFSILIPLPFLRLSRADATRAKNLGSCSNL